MNNLSPIEAFLCVAIALQLNLAIKQRKIIDCVMTQRIIHAARDLESLVWYLPHLSFRMEMDLDKMAQKPDFNLIDYRLSDAELDAFEVWFEKQAPNPTETLIALAEKSYKVSLTYVENSSAWCISITGQKDAKFNAASTLTTWADEPLEGLYMAYFKAMVVFEGGVWKTKTTSRRG